MNGTQSKFTVRDQHDVAKFVNKAIESDAKSGVLFDSANATGAAMEALKGDAGSKPRVIDELLGASSMEEEQVVGALFDGVRAFEREHGFRPTGDVLLSAIAQGKDIFDSVTNNHHDQISITQNAPLVAILSAVAEAVPFAGYLPADRGSNEARLIIVSHQAGSDWGDYDRNGLMDGIKQGGGYLGSARTMELAAPNATTDYKFTFLSQATKGTAVKLLRGRVIVYVNGMPAIQETQNGSSALATVSIVGSVNIAGTDYGLTGTVKPDSGEVVVSPASALPAGTVVTAEAFVDYENQPDSTPRMQVQAQVFSLFASPFRGIYQVTPESRSQFSNEVGVDAGAEAMMSVRGQFAMERHYNVLKKAKMIAKFANSRTYDFAASTQLQQKIRAQVWQDFASVLGLSSQQMAEDTADHGITHLYVTKSVAAQFRSMPRELFEPSGIVDRPGIFRVGRLFGLFEVYYSPAVVTESPDGSTAEILCVGRSTQTARCPIIMGDASAPMFEPLGTTEQLKSGYGFNSRCFNNVNPHLMSAKGCALITVTNLK
jgi:hypothetical protein